MPDYIYVVGSAHRILLHLYIAVAFIDPHCEYQDAGKQQAPHDKVLKVPSRKVYNPHGDE